MGFFVVCVDFFRLWEYICLSGFDFVIKSVSDVRFDSCIGVFFFFLILNVGK